MPLVDFNSTGEFSQELNQIQARHSALDAKASEVYGHVSALLNNLKADYSQPVPTLTWDEISLGADLAGQWGAPYGVTSLVFNPPPTVTDPSSAIDIGTVERIVPLPVPSVTTALPARPGAAPAVTIGATESLSDPSLGAIGATLPSAPGSSLSGFGSFSPDVATTITLAGAPTLVPAVSTTTLPTLAALSLPTFNLTLPDLAIDDLIAPFTFTDASYAGRMNTVVQAKLGAVIGGEVVIGSSVFRGIYDDAKSDLSATYADALIGAGNAAGMLAELPSEPLLARIDQATTQYRQGVQKASLATRIEQAKAWREDVWKGIDAAHAYETLWSSIHIAEYGRRLQAAIAATQAAVAVYNSNVQGYNLSLAHINAAISIAAEQRARAALVLDDHKERLAQREQELRTTDREVALYQAHWQGYSAQAGAETNKYQAQVAQVQVRLEGMKASHAAAVADFTAQVQRYQAEVSAVNAKLGIAAEERQRAMLALETYKARLAGRAAVLADQELKLKSWLGEWDGYAKAATADATLISARIQAFNAGLEQNKAVFAADEGLVKLQLTKEQAITQRWATEWSGMQIKAQAALTDLQAQALPYETRIKSEMARLGFQEQQLSLVIENAKLNQGKSIAEAQLNLKHLEFQATMRQHTNDTLINTMANIYSGLMGSAQTSMSSSAGMSYGLTNSGSACPCP